MSVPSESDLADRFFAALEPFEHTPPARRMRVRIKDHGYNVIDERKHFRELQKACRESEEIAQALRDAGFGEIATMGLVPPSPATGLLVNAFNRMVEQHWMKQ